MVLQFLNYLSHTHRHQRHGVITENIDHLDGDRVTTGLGVDVRRGGEFECAILPRAEALPLVFENVAAGPAFLEFDLTPLALRGVRGEGSFSSTPRLFGTLMISLRCM